MAITYEKLMNLKAEPLEFSYTERDSIFYALSVGLGRNPVDADELSYVYENAVLRAVPSQASVVARRNILLGSGIDRSRVVHGEQRLTLNRPLPPRGEVIARSRVVEALDKGEGKGALIYVETAVSDAGSGELLFSTLSTSFARGDGGFGGPEGPGLAPHTVPERPPDLSVETTTRPEQALLYRLNGDLNPLHADPVLARSVGFEAPILHGLCSYGIACRQILGSVAAYDNTRIATFDVRFSAPIYPGETIVTQIWVDGSVVSYESFCKERQVKILSNGKCTLN